MRLRRRPQPVSSAVSSTGERRPHEHQCDYFDDQSPYADRLTLAGSFASDDETRATAQDLRTYSRLSWHRGWLGAERPVRRRR